MFLVVYARIYGTAMLDALASIAKSAWTLILPIALVFAFIALSALLGPLGPDVSGFLLSLARAAAFSVYSYFLAQLVAKNRASVKDLKTSLGAYFWTWVNLFFVLWIVGFVVGRAMMHHPQGPTLIMVLSLMELIVLNAAPEIIYLKGSYGGLETIQRSFAFLQENWIEWFVPNALILAGWWFFTTGVISFGMLPFAAVTGPILIGALLHVLMVFRGFLFEILDGSTHRQRMFRFRGKL
jgi:hypothetical protein